MNISWSLRNRLRWWATIAGTSVLSIAALGMYAGLQTDLRTDFDAILLYRAKLMAGLVWCDERQIAIEFDAAQHPEFTRDDRPDYWCCRTPDGRAMFRSPSLLVSGEELPPVATDLSTPQFAQVRLPDGRAGRAISLLKILHTRREEDDSSGRSSSLPVIVTLAVDTAALDHDLRNLAWLLGGITTAAILAIALVMDQVARRLVRPIDHLASRIAELGADRLNLHSRDLEVPAELAPVIERLDKLLDRLGQALRRERSLGADLAHELRTPLAGLRTGIEVALRHPRSAEDYRTTIEECHEICLQTQGMVDTLLELARADNERSSVHIGRIAIGDVLSEAWKLKAAEALQRRLQATWNLEPARVLIDPVHLRLIINNLLGNAVAYSNQGGSITITVHRRDGRVLISIANTGCTLTPDQANQVFDRFWRGDKARGNTGLHCGLGLTLCRTLVTINDGTIEVRIADGCFTVTLSLGDGDVERA